MANSSTPTGSTSEPLPADRREWTEPKVTRLITSAAEAGSTTPVPDFEGTS